MKSRISLWTVVILIVVSLFAGMEIRQIATQDPVDHEAGKLREVLSLTQKYYFQDVDSKKLTEAAIEGMLEKLDPHSVYIAPRAVEQVAEDFKGEFEGVGIRFVIRNDSIFVVEPIGGGPSARLGIQSNDRIVRINDTSAIGYKDDQVRSRLRGPKGTRVKVSVYRPGEKELLEYEIIRDKIALTSVDVALMIDKEVAYLSVNRFSDKTDQEMLEALVRLKSQGMKRLILDLRYNPGGLLNQAFEMADLFLDGGTKQSPHKIVYTKARREQFEEVFYASTGQPFEKLPLIILLSNYSASASEIVAGAVQDWDRGLIVGETSFGKGLVQKQFALSDGSALRLTIARYFTPSGRLIQREYEGKGKGEYESEAFQRQETEGENPQHKVEGDSGRPVFKTHAGRVVYGGGGITPDYVVKSPAYSTLMRTLLRRGLVEQFVSTYMDGKGLKIRSEYAKDWNRFKTSFVVTDELMTDFRSFVSKREITINEKEYDQDLRLIKTRMKAAFARNIWGNEGWYPVILQVDPQFQKALSLFPEAEKIAKLD